MSNRLRDALIVVGAAAAIALFIALRPEDTAHIEPAVKSNEQLNVGSKRGDKPKKPKPPPEPEIPTISVKGGEPVGGVQELTFESGSQMRFAVEADVADHAHLHGYDVSEDVAPGKAAEFNLPADIEGVFELELEAAGLPIAEISVVP